MDCTIFLSAEAKDIERRLREEIFHHYWELSALAQSFMADCWLARDCLLAGDTRYPDAYGYAVRATVDWALDKLRHKENERSRQSYDVLVKRYLERMSNKEYADLRFISDWAGDARRRTAIRRVVEILRQEVESPTEAQQRKEKMIAWRYSDCDQEQQLILRFLAIFEEAVSLTIVMQVEQIQLQPHLSQLLAANLLISDDDASLIWLHPEIRPYLLTLLTADERHRWHSAAGCFYEQQGKLIRAVYHLQHAMQPQRAAHLLIKHQDEIGKALPIVPLQERLAEFQRPDLPVNTWAQLKILEGQAAEFAKELNVARLAYEEALAAEDDAIKAEAYYYLAYLHEQEQREIEVAFDFYANCKALLANAKTQKSIWLKADVYIREAWFLIEHGSDFTKVTQNLQEAERLIENCLGKKKHRLRSDLHTTWGLLYTRQKPPKLAQELKHRRLAWQDAREADDRELKINTAYNLGVVYRRNGNYDEARLYFEESQMLALKAGNLRMAAISRKGIGNCYVSILPDDERAIPYYLQAHRYFQETGNKYWQAAVCHDLAEVYAPLGESILAKQYFDEGMSLLEEPGGEWVKEYLHQLAQSYVELTDDLNDRQRQAIGYIRRNESIKRNEYEDLTGIKKRMAVNDLKDLLEKGICIKGKGWRYELAPLWQH